MRSEIDAYIRDHGTKYTTDALRKQLIEAGFDPTEVEAALREAEAAGTPGAPRPSGAADVAWYLYFVCAVIGTGGALTLVSFLGQGSGGSDEVVFIAVNAIAYLGLGYVVARMVRAATSAFEIHGLGAVLLGIGLVPVFALLMFGTCVAALNLATGLGG